MKAFGCLLSANMHELTRDRMAIFWFFAFPVLFMVMFGAIFARANDNQNYEVGIVLEEKGAAGRAFYQAFSSVTAFTMHQGTRNQELKALKKGERALVVVIPTQAGALLNNNPSDISVYYDNSRQQTNNVLLPAAEQVINEVERGVTNRPRLVNIQTQAVQAIKLKQIDYLLPGILAMVLMQLGLFGAMRLVNLRERKILKRLGVTPLPRSLLIGSEVTTRLIMALAQTVSIVFIGYVLFDVAIVGGWGQVIGLVLLGAATFVSIGYMLVSFARTEESGQGILQLVQFPMMFLSGIFFPVNVMPGFLQPIVKAIPLTYLGDALRQVMTGAAPLYSLNTDIIIMLAWLVVSVAAAVRFFQWE